MSNNTFSEVGQALSINPTPIPQAESRSITPSPQCSPSSNIIHSTEINNVDIPLYYPELIHNNTRSRSASLSSMSSTYVHSVSNSPNET